MLANATKGNTEAQVQVFHTYYFGEEGVARDLALAFKFCCMAAMVVTSSAKGILVAFTVGAKGLSVTKGRQRPGI